MGEIQIREFTDNDFQSVHKIFNLFIQSSFAAYTETELSSDRLKELMKPAKIILILHEDENIIGFGYVASYKPLPNFSRTGVLTYFIRPEFTGQGLGTILFNELTNRGIEIGITNYLASISSRNEQSLNFHKKHGFDEVGRFKNVGTKFGKDFDIVWVQKQFLSGEKDHGC